MNSPRPPKEFIIVPVVETPLLNKLYEEGWDVVHLQFTDAGFLRGVFSRDKAVVPVLTPEPTPKPTLISEATPITPPAPVTEQPIIPPAPAPEPTTDQPEAESVDEAHTEDTTPPKGDEQPVIIVMPNLYPPMDFETEMRRIRADNSLSPMEKNEAIKKAGNEIALAKARIAGEQAWDAWNRLYPVSENFRFSLLEEKAGAK